jgi:hypothetical protein
MILKSALSPIFACVLALAGELAQAEPDTPSLTGTWRLVSMTRVDETGTAHPFWGDQPLGLLIYTSDGHVSAQVYDARRPRLGVARDSVTPEAARTAFVGLSTYFGTYAIDSEAGTVTHTVEGAMSPDWVGAKMVRSYKFVSPNQVELRVVPDAQVTTVGLMLTWERVQ